WLYTVGHIEHTTKTYTLVGSGGQPVWFDAEDVAVPHFARLESGKPPGVLAFDSDAGAIHGDWSAKSSAVFPHQPDAPLLEGAIAIGGRFPSHRAVSFTQDGLVLARAPGENTTLRLTLDSTATNPRYPFLATACDIDGDGADEAILGFDGQTTKIYVV